MKLIVSMILFLNVVFAFDADTVKALYVCKTPKEVLLITLIDNADPTVGGGLFIDNWENLVDEDLSYFVPVQNKKTFRGVVSTTLWVSSTFGKSSCVKMSKEDVDLEYKRQSADYQRMFK